MYEYDDCINYKLCKKSRHDLHKVMEKEIQKTSIDEK